MSRKRNIQGEQRFQHEHHPTKHVHMAAQGVLSLQDVQKPPMSQETHP